MGIARWLWSSLALLATSAGAAERYTEAYVTQIKPGDNGVTLFLDVVAGDAPPVGNGGSNESVNKPFLLLANSATDVTNRHHFMAAALMAQTQHSLVRFRWEDVGTNASRIVVMLLRSPS